MSAHCLHTYQTRFDSRHMRRASHPTRHGSDLRTAPMRRQAGSRSRRRPSSRTRLRTATSTWPRSWASRATCSSLCPTARLAPSRRRWRASPSGTTPRPPCLRVRAVHWQPALKQSRCQCCLHVPLMFQGCASSRRLLLQTQCASRNHSAAFAVQRTAAPVHVATIFLHPAAARQQCADLYGFRVLP